MSKTAVGSVLAVLSGVSKEVLVLCALTQCSFTEHWCFHSEQSAVASPETSVVHSGTLPVREETQEGLESCRRGVLALG